MKPLNPIIHEHNPDETIHRAVAVIEFLQQVHPIDGEALGENAEFGYYQVLGCIGSALEYEEGRVETLRKEGTS